MRCMKRAKEPGQKTKPLECRTLVGALKAWTANEGKSSGFHLAYDL